MSNQSTARLNAIAKNLQLTHLKGLARSRHTLAGMNRSKIFSVVSKTTNIFNE